MIINQKSTSIINANGRYAIIDALRGIALLAMFAFHFSFDLNYFGLIRQNFYEDPFWTGSRTLILSSFLLLIGISLALANQNEIRWSAVWRRFGQIVVCAALVSIGSYLMLPKSWIWFGVLHHAAVASLLGLAFLRLEWANLVLGIALVLFGATVKIPLFDAPIFQWLGLMTHKPFATEDYAPILPWFGIVLMGIFLGKRFLSGEFAHFKGWRPESGALRGLTFAGRHSLILYMVHQPILVGLLHLFLIIFKNDWVFPLRSLILT
jgi:uncharacterized membrane protein